MKRIEAPENQADFDIRQSGMVYYHDGPLAGSLFENRDVAISIMQDAEKRERNLSTASYLIQFPLAVWGLREFVLGVTNGNKTNLLKAVASAALIVIAKYAVEEAKDASAFFNSEAERLEEAPQPNYR